MKKKAKGMTLVEIIIALSLTTIVLIVIGTFFVTNSKILTSADIKSDLQKDIDNIQTEMIKIGTESKGISHINWNNAATPDAANLVDYGKLSTESATENQLKITEVDFSKYKTDNIKDGTNDYKFVFSKDSGKEFGKLTLIYPSGTEKVLSENVVDMSIKPLDIDSTKSMTSQNFGDAGSVEIVVNLRKKSGFVDTTLPVNMVIYMRNKDAVAVLNTAS